MKAPARILIVAGSDPSGGAGIQADIKTVTALGGYAMTAITALTVQNTLGVTDVFEAPEPIVRAQIRACLSDIGADAAKTGMLATAQLVEAVAEELSGARAPLVCDPVMVAKGGASLIAEQAVAALVSSLLKLAALVTPNAPEAERLTGLEVRDADGQMRAGEKLLKLGAAAALVKGGHVEGEIIRDVLVWEGGVRVFESPRIHTQHTHGTGCTLASAIATGLGAGKTLPDAVEAARDYVHHAILYAPGFGGGAGPLDHGWTFRSR
jgi:hydroxymethylpyrimidine/phosphomethylpyrimidine kinase